ncbi:MAG: hypothetical protein R3Y58_00400 [Eubacteriales bacterium]
MKKTRRIFAIIGIICLVALYASTLIFALIDTTTSFFYFKCSIAATIFVPVMLYVMALVYKQGKNSDSVSDETSDSTDDATNQSHNPINH